MNDVNVRRWTGAFGIAYGVSVVVAFALYVVVGITPRAEDTAKFSNYVTKNSTFILTITLIFPLGAACYVVFLAGLAI